MELHVLHDELGNILAAVRIDREPAPHAAIGGEVLPSPRPMPGPGQYTADVKVPDEFANLSFFEVCDQCVLEAHGSGATLKRRAGSAAD